MPVRRYRIEGRVQGVGYRYFTRRTARRLGIKGLVRNLPDGTVEAIAEGSAEALEAMEHWLRAGPPGSRVDGVKTTEETRLVEDEDFVIA
ncbi:MAG TPA: acylphosphatase [Candidatus Polarisedimenticolia bacterium]|jgi:acylphosphatase|nr:acylphosphatase [Candidatus Polarisedimenticolia bacterium]